MLAGPALGALVNGLWPGRLRGRVIHGVLACVASGVAFVVAVLQHIQLATSGQESIRQSYFTWIASGPLSVDFALRLDPLASVMCLTVSGVAFLIHIYSLGYMAHDKAYVRFFCFMNMFTTAMLLLVTAANLPVMFIGWEGVGLCSYLLIGFWHTRDSASRAGFKAFVVNRVGDFGFIIATLWCYKAFGTLDLHDMIARVDHASAADIRWITLLFFLAATGKSAQIPLYVWLPDAMEGPTPVSALIHAATMVTAGIYLVVRLNAFYHHPSSAAGVVAWIGALTALLAATIAVGQNDIKRVLAYSTVSQLGYMFLAAGVGAYTAAIFHLVTHAFFKACLFLGAGSVIHACHEEQDILRMGALRHKMAVTHWTFLASTLSIAGIVPLAGFFSKDEILAGAFGADKLLWALGLAGAFLTAFYMLRLLYLTFYGNTRMAPEAHERAHESPPSMGVPLRVLAALAIVGGLLGVPGSWHLLRGYLEPLLPRDGAGEHLSMPVEVGLMAISVAVALCGILVAASLFLRRADGQERLERRLGDVYLALRRKWWIDEVYVALVVGPLSALARACSDWFDPKVIDGTVNGLAATVGALARGQVRSQTGRIRDYAVVILTGALILALCLVLGRL